MRASLPDYGNLFHLQPTTDYLLPTTNYVPDSCHDEFIIEIFRLNLLFNKEIQATITNHDSK